MKIYIAAGYVLCIALLSFPPLFANGLEIYGSAAAEVFFFNTVDLDKAEELVEDSDSRVTYDFAGRKNKMRYEISPVYLASYEGYVKYGFWKFDTQYKTDRVFGGGGTIEHNDAIAADLSKNDTVSEVLKLGLSAFGFSTSYRTVNFNFGKAEVIDAASGDVVAEGNLNLSIQEFVFMYDLGHGGKSFLWPYVGYKYMDYSLPRVVYRLEDENGKAEYDHWIYTNEAEPQDVPARLHMIGAGWQNIDEERTQDFTLLYRVGLYAGAGRSEFNYINRDDDVEPYLAGAQIHLTPGLAWKLPAGGLDTSLRLLYEINGTFFGSGIRSIIFDREDKGEAFYTFGQIDVYHGGNFAFEIRF